MPSSIGRSPSWVRRSSCSGILWKGSTSFGLRWFAAPELTLARPKAPHVAGRALSVSPGGHVHRPAPIAMRPLRQKSSRFLRPRQNSSGGKERLGRVSKMGNRYLRKLLVVGAHAVLYHRKPHEDALRSFAKKLMQTKPFKLVAVALANKMARIVFAIMRGGTTYSAAPV